MPGFDRNSPTHPRIVRAKAREEKSLELRMAGYTYEKIGEELGITAQAAFAAVKRAITNQAKKRSEDVETYRQMQLHQLDKLQSSLWDKAINGDVNAVDRILKILDRRAKLLGIDAEKDEHIIPSVTIHVVTDQDRGNNGSDQS